VNETQQNMQRSFDGRSTVPGHIPTSWRRPKRVTVVWLALVTLAYGGFLFLAAPEQGILDARLFYGPGAIHELLTRQGEEGREAYMAAALADLGFIVVHAALLITWIRFLRNRFALPRKLPGIVGAVPALFDLVETGSIISLLQSYPEQPQAIAWAAVIATPLKWVSVVAIAVLVVRGEVRLAKRKRR
jgi:hypothetical protein